MENLGKTLEILITNDDGIHAPGFKALICAAGDLGRVTVVAPRSERSACSHALSLGKAIGVERVDVESIGDAYAVDGTPADCVLLACSELLDKPPDLILSGVNEGANVGVDIFYSGTVAAAREGAILGIHSISVSQAIRQGVAVNWNAVASITRSLVGQLAREALPRPGFWNVNLPVELPADPMARVRRIPVAPGAGPTNFHRTDLADGRMEFRYGRDYWDRKTPPGTDFRTICDGDIAVSSIFLWD